MNGRGLGRGGQREEMRTHVIVSKKKKKGLVNMNTIPENSLIILVN